PTALSAPQKAAAAAGCRRRRRVIPRGQENPSRLRPSQTPRHADTMAASNSGAGGGGPISAEASAALGEGIRLVFGRWTALQMAVENQWGGRNSRAKADQLGADILSWFCNSKGPHYFEDLADMIDEQISELFSADFEDNSIDEIAGDDNDSDSSDDDDDETMMDDAAVAAPEEMAVDRPRPSGPVPDADGWTVVPPRRGRGNN
ncbi:unnamed protein product, partial [Urochloa humidicola]